MGMNGPWSDGSEGVLHIPQSSNVTGTLPLDCLVPYPGHLLEREDLTPLQRSSQCILPLQPTEQTVDGAYHKLEQFMTT